MSATGSAKQALKIFCVDFNWDMLGRAASPGLYAHADPEVHLNWYRNLGVNAIQTFCVTYNGFAWYPSEVAPVTPGLKTNFLGSMVTAGHKLNLQVFGYFCLGSNPYWEGLHREEAHPPWITENGVVKPVSVTIPFTIKYLEYFCACLRDTLQKVEIDGFMLDWFSAPKHKERLPCEKVMFEELMGENFPAGAQPADDVTLEFNRRSLERAWSMIKRTVDETRSVKIWPNPPFHNADDPLFRGLRFLKEADMLLNEWEGMAVLPWLATEVGPQTKIIQNFCGGGLHNAESMLKDFDHSRFGIYGFAQADPATTLPFGYGMDGRETGVNEEGSPKTNFTNIQYLRKIFHVL